MDETTPDQIFQIKICDKTKRDLLNSLKDTKGKLRHTTGEKRKEFKRELHRMQGLIYALEDRKKHLRTMRTKHTPSPKEKVKDKTTSTDGAEKK